MDALELLKSWPGWRNAGAEMVLASPAWRLPVRFGSETGLMTVSGEVSQDPILVDITLDGEAHQLAIADSPRYLDLHLLWSRRSLLPENLLLALVEKECGSVLQLIENVTRRQVALKGLASVAVELRPFDVTGTSSFQFAIDLTPDLVSLLGRIERLDTDHEAIRTLTRPAVVRYGTVPLTDEEVSALSVGDYLLLPEGFGAEAAWMSVEDQAEATDASESVGTVFSSETVALTFAEFAEEKYPAVPEVKTVSVRIPGREPCRCEAASVGVSKALKIIG